MARNEEKQQGRLNRLWLQKEREEGRLKDTRETRPKLVIKYPFREWLALRVNSKTVLSSQYTLNTAASVKKWIPSIKNEMEYYLQQSQLTHYPERKIAEFQFKIDALEKEYKSFITKLRVLDPSCKHQPWTPRAYCKRRADQQTSHCAVKKPHAMFTEGNHESNEDNSRGACCMGTLKISSTETLLNTSENQTRSILDSPEQDLPLSFDQSRLAVAVASFRGSSAALGLTKTNKLARVLQSGLPNLGSSATTYNQQNLTNKNQRLIQSEKSHECKYSVPSREEPNHATTNHVTPKQLTGTPLNTGSSSDRGNLLGLGCYSSSDEEEDP